MPQREFESAWFREILACPDCGGGILLLAGDYSCQACGFLGAEGDLRARRAPPLSVSLARVQATSPGLQLRGFEIGRPVITYSGPQAIRDSRELMSLISAELKPPGRILDLGCGPGDQRAPIEHLGFQYVGADYSSKDADLLADAHALPFASDSFDCVFSYAVLEHLHNPHVAIREVERVLSPGGIYVGTVSQGEPFHDSYFHHTAWGLLSLLSSTRTMRLERAWAGNDTLRALARMGRYSRLLRGAFSLLDVVNRRIPLLTPRKMRWPLSERRLDELHRAGSIAFLVRKARRGDEVPVGV